MKYDHVKWGDDIKYDYVINIEKEAKQNILDKLNIIYNKLLPATVGDKMIWVGENYSRADLLKDVEELLK